jgi:hypothetical protein
MQRHRTSNVAGDISVLSNPEGIFGDRRSRVTAAYVQRQLPARTVVISSA